jgi:hypothetical protein
MHQRPLHPGPMEDSRPPTLMDVVARWWLRGSLAGISISLLVHLAVLGVAAIWTITVAQAGGAGNRDTGEIELAVASETELAGLEGAALEVQTPNVADSAMADAPSPEPLGVGDPVLSEGSLNAGGGLGGVTDGMGGAGGDIGGSAGLGEGGSGGGASKFFGLEATGTRFAYIVDVSGSMQGPKLQMLRTELIESITSLMEHATFYVVPFSNDAAPMGNRTKWTQANDAGKKWIREQATHLNAYGGTNPLPAFQLVFEMNPRPDAIYFMTDGLFEESAAVEIAKMNKRGHKAPIHCIGLNLEEKGAEENLKKIAQDSGGRFIAVPLPGTRK